MSTYGKYLAYEKVRTAPEEMNNTVINTLTPVLDNAPAALSSMRSMNKLIRFSRDEYTFSTDRIANIAGYCTYLKKACAARGLFEARIKDKVS